VAASSGSRSYDPKGQAEKWGDVSCQKPVDRLRMPAMADESYTDDISALWGPDSEAGLSPAPPSVNGAGSREAEPEPVDGIGKSQNGNGIAAYAPAVEQDRRNEVARLAEDIVNTHEDVVRRSDLAVLRSELEGTFTHQLAVALYELMSTSNARLTQAEDDINQRVQEAVERQTIRLATSLDAQHKAASEMTDVIWGELDPLRQRVVGPIDGLAGFQRELRHEVGCLNDLVSAHRRESTERVQRLDRNDDRVARWQDDDLGNVSETVAAIREDLSALHSEVAELRSAVESRDRQARKSRWRNRNR
jgi:hypothetical protein